MNLIRFGRFIKRNLSFAWGIIKKLFKKYQRDNANIIVSSISFYILLTFIPFTLLTIYILGYIIDMSSPGIHLERYLSNILPSPYNGIITRWVIRELDAISVSKKLSGPLGLLFLFFFTTKLFSIIRPSFRIIFGKHPERFLRAKEKEILFAFIFSMVQVVLFFSFIFSVVMHTKIVSILPNFLSIVHSLYIFSFLDLLFTFIMFYLLYYFLTPVIKSKKILVISSVVGTLFWHMGKYLFKFYILHLGQFTTFFGTYGILLAFLFWVYFSVFVFIVCAELESILVSPLSRGPVPSSSPFPGIPSGARKG